MAGYNESMLVNEIIRGLYKWVHLQRANVIRGTHDGRRLNTGLPKGFPDLFGTLPAEKNRYGVAVPVFIECKRGYNKPTPEQAKFIADELAKGSIAGVCYSVEDAFALIRPHLKNARDVGSV